jgi:D-aminopeptidase
MPRPADLGIRIGSLPPGATDSVIDVPGVGLGHSTVWRDEPPPPAGRGVARTGVTALLVAEDAYTRPVVAGGAVLNGAGECTGFLSANEWGVAETPVLLTSTMQVGRVYDAACQILQEAEPTLGEDVTIPVVAECDDSFLSDARRMQVTVDDVRAAWAAAVDSVGQVIPPTTGSVGAGTGMSCMGFKGGVGTASRVVPSGHTVGVLVLANFGQRDRLSVDGVPVGRLLPPDPYEPSPGPAGSCIGVVVTDAPLDTAACSRLARRVGLGLARVGSTAHHGSGEIFLCCATGIRADRDGGLHGPPPVTGRALDPFFEAVVDAAEEAVLDALLSSPTTVGRDGNTREGLPPAEVVRMLGEAGRL